MPSKKEYERRKAAGLCPRCGKRPAGEEKTTCQECLDRDNAVQRDRYDGKKAEGLCGKCGKQPPVTGKTHCQECLELKQGSYGAKKDAGLCPCGNRPPVTGKVNCQPCLDRVSASMKDLHDEREAAGLCRRCGSRPPANGNKWCSECSDRNNALIKATRDERKAAGLCIRCGEPSELVECHECKRNGLRKHTPFLRFRDGQNCHICRSRLPEENSSDVHVHHVIPRAMDGPDDLENLSLTHARCNWAVGARWVPHIPPGSYTLGGESGNPSSFVSYTTGTLDGSANM